jgi:hypothetical protein
MEGDGLKTRGGLWVEKRIYLRCVFCIEKGSSFCNYNFKKLKKVAKATSITNMLYLVLYRKNKA